MTEREVYRPNLAASLMGLVGLPLVAALLTGLAVVLVIDEPAPLAIPWVWVFPAAILFLAGLVVYLAGVFFRGWFAIHVDAEALSIVGLFGSWRLTLPWRELEAVGLVRLAAPVPAATDTASSADAAQQALAGLARLHDVPFLGVRPLHSWPRKPRWGLWSWDPERRLLLIAGLDKWSAPRTEMIAGLARHAGIRWVDPLAELPALPRRN